jgi:hypothetical protein
MFLSVIEPSAMVAVKKDLGYLKLMIEKCP